MLVVPMMIGSETVEAAGSGTQDDPYFGTVKITPELNRDTHYILRGTMFSITVKNDPLDLKYYVYDENTERYVGVTYVTIALGKTSTFVVDFEFDSFFLVESGDTSPYGTYCIVDPAPPYPDLEFLSDPIIDGTVSYGN